MAGIQLPGPSSPAEMPESEAELGLKSRHLDMGDVGIPRNASTATPYACLFLYFNESKYPHLSIYFKSVQLWDLVRGKLKEWISEYKI